MLSDDSITGSVASEVILSKDEQWKLQQQQQQQQQQRQQQQQSTKMNPRVVISSFSLRHYVYLFFVLCFIMPARDFFSIQASIQRGLDMDTLAIAVITPAQKVFQKVIPASCSFRQYGQHRTYGMASSAYPPQSLKQASYIHGEPPIVLATSSSNKLCATLMTDVVDEYTMDGTNPSILSLQHLSNNNAIYAQWKQHYPTAKYLVSLTFKANHQCTYSYNTTTNEPDWKIPRAKPLEGRKTGKEADVMLLDENFRTLATTTVQKIVIPEDHPSTPKLTVKNIDDTRLLLHDDQIWISYKLYGKNQTNIMFMSQLEMSINPDTQEWNAVATNQIEILYGRNMGALQQQPQSTDKSNDSTTTAALSLLSWPDPLWVQTVHIQTPASKATDDARKQQYILKNPDTTKGRSHFHGTSNTLIYLPQYDEYLGIGHFHRSIDEDPRHMHGVYGHHYTHAFFTFGKIQDDPNNSTTNNATTAENQTNNTTDNHPTKVTSPKFELRKISQEFVMSSQVAGYANDGDIIQFASGLEVVYADENNKTGNATPRSPSELIIGYGINDCEGAISVIKWSTVDEMLRPVSPGTEVRHTLKQVPAWIDESETVA